MRKRGDRETKEKSTIARARDPKPLLLLVLSGSMKVPIEVERRNQELNENGMVANGSVLHAIALITKVLNDVNGFTFRVL